MLHTCKVCSTSIWIWIVLRCCCWRCLLDQEVQEVCVKHPVIVQVPYIFICHRESDLKGRIAWKVLSFLLVLSSCSRRQRRIAAGSDGSLAPCCHYAIYKLWLLIMQECDTWTWISSEPHSFNWRYICCPTYVTAVRHCTHRILYLFIEDKSAIRDYMRIWCSDQPLITEMLFFSQPMYLNCGQNNEPSLSIK